MPLKEYTDPEPWLLLKADGSSRRTAAHTGSLRERYEPRTACPVCQGSGESAAFSACPECSGTGTGLGRDGLAARIREHRIQPMLAIDFETTGLDDRRDAVLEFTMKLVSALKRLFRIDRTDRATPKESLSRPWPAYADLVPVPEPDQETEDGRLLTETPVTLEAAEAAARDARAELFLKDPDTQLAGVHVHPVTGAVSVSPNGIYWFDTGKRAELQ